MNAADKVARARARLLLARPWWANLLLQLKVVEGTTYGTMETDGVHLFYEPAWVDTLSLDQVEGVLCHEVAHCFLHHLNRMGSRDPARWNYAADECVNAILAADGIMLPAGGVPPGPLDETVEERYHAEPAKKFAKQQAAGSGAGGKHFRDIVPPGAGSGKAEEQGRGTGRPASASHNMTQGQLEAKWKQALQQAAGLTPGNLRRTIDRAIEPKERWQDKLARFAQRFVKSPDRTWTRASRRLPGLAPGPKREPEVRIAIVFDTSGSVTGPLLGAFVAEARGILAVQGTTAYILSADAAVHTVVEPGEEFPDTLGGGGGTDFRPAIEHCERLPDVAAIIYLTDGMGTFPAGCSKPVLWALSQPCNVPFGESINLYE